MSVAASRYTVTTTAAAAYTAPGEQQVVTVKNPPTASASVYVGGSGVTTAAGYELTPGETVTVTMYASQELHAIIAASTQEIQIIASTDV